MSTWHTYLFVAPKIVFGRAFCAAMREATQFTTGPRHLSGPMTRVINLLPCMSGTCRGRGDVPKLTHSTIAALYDKAFLLAITLWCKQLVQ